MGKHDKYGKRLLKEILGDNFKDNHKVEGFDIGIKLDGKIADKCAVEIESRVDKQIRGAILDLLLCKLEKKLLMIIPKHMHDKKKTVESCQLIFRQMGYTDDNFRVVLLNGTGDDPKDKDDIKIIKKELGAWI